MKFSFKTEEKRSSLDSFKAKADAVVAAESIDKITGGALADCHGGGGVVAIKAASVQLAAVARLA